MNKDVPTTWIKMFPWLFPSLSRHGERFFNARIRSKITTHNLSFDTEIFKKFLKQFLLKYRCNECQKILESFKKKELKLLGRQAQNLQHNNFKKTKKDGLFS